MSSSVTTEAAAEAKEQPRTGGPSGATAPSAAAAVSAAAVAPSSVSSAAAPVGGRVVAESLFELFHTELLGLLSGVGESRFQDVPALSRWRIVVEGVGYESGYRFTERLARFRAVSADPLDAVKFLCREFWTEVFKRPIDNLKTNHRGTFVLQDAQFRLVLRARTDEMRARLLWLPCGFVRGAMACLGFECTVHGEIQQAPNCFFTLRLRS